MSKKRTTDNTIIRNKKAGFHYEILEKLECGVVLLGSEVKSLRNHEVSIEEAYARIEQGELWLMGCNIKPYEQAGRLNHEATRKRKLLLHNREMQKWHSKVQLRGLTLVPLDMHFNGRGVAKVTIALVRGKTHGDKRQSLKKREHQREMDRAMRQRR